MLSSIRNYIQMHKLVSIEQLSREFCIAPDALHPMLEIWIKKDCIRVVKGKENCGSACHGCHAQQIVYYEWV